MKAQEELRSIAELEREFRVTDQLKFSREDIREKKATQRKGSRNMNRCLESLAEC